MTVINLDDFPGATVVDLGGYEITEGAQIVAGPRGPAGPAGPAGDPESIQDLVAALLAEGEGIDLTYTDADTTPHVVVAVADPMVDYVLLYENAKV